MYVMHAACNTTELPLLRCYYVATIKKLASYKIGGCKPKFGGCKSKSGGCKPKSGGSQPTKIREDQAEQAGKLKTVQEGYKPMSGSLQAKVREFQTRIRK
uniref:Uncharacterized protein n=1 Tax=Cacopsylla melanoneura TaxID=428564 RepID=A0A8D8ZCP4_9HEMI